MCVLRWSPRASNQCLKTSPVFEPSSTNVFIFNAAICIFFVSNSELMIHQKAFKSQICDILQKKFVPTNQRNVDLLVRLSPNEKELIDRDDQSDMV